MPQANGFISDEEADAAPQTGFISDEEMERLQAKDRAYRNADNMVTSAGKAALETMGDVSSAVDRFTGAPIRAAVGAYQTGKPVLPAFGNQFLRPAETAPSGKQIMANMGLSEEEFDTPLVKNPFTLEKYKASPAGIAGGAAETILDPTTYLGLPESGALKLGGRAVESVAPRVGESVGNFAAERAVKAATGENRAAIRKLAKAKGQTPGDVNKAVANLRKTGKILLESDESGGPAVGWLSNARKVGQNAAEKKQFYGKQIEGVGPLVDKYAYGSITPQGLSQDVGAFQKEIPNVGKGAPVRKRVGEEAQKLAAFDSGLAEEELGPAKPLSFAEAQKLKAQYPWEPQSPDILISDKDASNRINRIISNKMDEAAKTAAPLASEEERAVLEQYKPAKERYGTYKNVADAGAEQAMRTLGRRMISPSSHALGAIATLKSGGLYGIGAAALNQALLSRGSAFASRSANAISKRLMAAPETYSRWLPIMQKAAIGGNAAVLATHHQLMNNDPEYRRLMYEQPAEEP